MEYFKTKNSYLYWDSVTNYGPKWINDISKCQELYSGYSMTEYTDQTTTVNSEYKEVSNEKLVAQKLIQINMKTSVEHHYIEYDSSYT